MLTVTARLLWLRGRVDIMGCSLFCHNVSWYEIEGGGGVEGAAGEYYGLDLACPVVAPNNDGGFHDNHPTSILIGDYGMLPPPPPCFHGDEDREGGKRERVKRVLVKERETTKAYVTLDNIRAFLDN
ncbi:hypothetical protein JZ751_000609 [Albula glossodonta]|uniref:Uncharacterized protein n=1 Tax=Albula glossodonta TaxID=121402 RepID=A0A8T2PWW4_9TELE|nr:hypothetical protein JZ751_000609 [Albula glossodonta]